MQLPDEFIMRVIRFVGYEKSGVAWQPKLSVSLNSRDASEPEMMAPWEPRMTLLSK